MRSLWSFMWVAGVVGLVAACGEPPAPAQPPAPSGALAVEGTGDLGLDGRANANVSGASSGRVVVFVWSAAGADGSADVHASVSRDGARTFGAPVRVNDEVGTVRVSGEQPPRVTLVTRAGMAPVISVVWTAQGTEGTRLVTSRSEDGGRTFTPEALVPGTDAAGNRGWESIASFDDGRVVTAWLDHRDHAAGTDAARSHHEHVAGSDADGVAMAQRSQLYFAALGGDAPRPLTGGVCYCCKTALTVGALAQAESVAIAWRHVYPGNLRDIAFTLSRDGGRSFSEPVRVSEDQWSIAGCPDDGPAMVSDPKGGLHLVWPTAVTEEGQLRKALFHAMTSDGVTFSPRVPLPVEGQGNHPQVGIAPDGRLVAIWDESGSGTRTIGLAVATTGGDGVVRFERQQALAGEPGVYPVLMPTVESLVGAWTTGPPDRSRIRVVRLGASGPGASTARVTD